MLNFYEHGVTTTDTAPAATLSTPQGQGLGFQVNAASLYTNPDTGANFIFPEYFSNPATKGKPVQEGLFYGVFGSRISVDLLNKDSCSGSNCYVAGGVLGQAIVPGAARQGFVVAANGKGIVIDPKAPHQPDPPPLVLQAVQASSIRMKAARTPALGSQ